MKTHFFLCPICGNVIVKVDNKRDRSQIPTDEIGTSAMRSEDAKSGDAAIRVNGNATLTSGGSVGATDQPLTMESKGTTAVSAKNDVALASPGDINIAKIAAGNNAQLTANGNITQVGGDPAITADTTTLNAISTGNGTSTIAKADGSAMKLDTNTAGLRADNVAIENVTWTPEVEIRGNYFARIPTRGILVTTRRHVVIEQNTFFRMPMASILIADDARSWYESGSARDVTIRHNKFVECSSPVLLLWPENDRYDGPVHRNIYVTHNDISFMDPEHPIVLRAHAIENLNVSKNHYKTSRPIADLFQITDCTNTVIK